MVGDIESLATTMESWISWQWTITHCAADIPEALERRVVGGVGCISLPQVSFQLQSTGIYDCN